MCYFPRTNCPRRVSFSQFVILMSTTNSEKDSLLRQLSLGTFFVQHPLSIQQDVRKLANQTDRQLGRQPTSQIATFRLSYVTSSMWNAYNVDPWDMLNISMRKSKYHIDSNTRLILNNNLFNIVAYLWKTLMEEFFWKNLMYELPWMTVNNKTNSCQGPS